MDTSTEPTYSTATIGVGGLVVGLAVIFVALRFYIRTFTRLGLWWDDWLLLAAVVTTIATAALLLVANDVDSNGAWVSEAADPEYIYTPSDETYMKLSYIASLLYFTISGLSKLGILLMYMRLFYISPGFRTQVIVASVLVLAYWLSATIATLLTCRPMYYLWSSGSGYPDFCFNYNDFWMAMGIYELFLDVVILALPVRAVMAVKLSRRKKISVIGIFLLGGFVIVTGIVKVVLAYNPGGHVPLYGAAEVWVTLHAGISIVCACLPIMKPLITRFFSSTAFSTRGSTTPRGQYPSSQPSGQKPVRMRDGDMYGPVSETKSQVDTKVSETRQDDLESGLMS